MHHLADDCFPGKSGLSSMLAGNLCSYAPNALHGRSATKRPYATWNGVEYVYDTVDQVVVVAL